MKTIIVLMLATLATCNLVLAQSLFEQDPASNETYALFLSTKRATPITSETLSQVEGFLEKNNSINNSDIVGYQGPENVNNTLSIACQIANPGSSKNLKSALLIISNPTLDVKPKLAAVDLLGRGSYQVELHQIAIQYIESEDPYERMIALRALELLTDVPEDLIVKLAVELEKNNVALGFFRGPNQSKIVKIYETTKSPLVQKRLINALQHRTVSADMKARLSRKAIDQDVRLMVSKLK